MVTAGLTFWLFVRPLIAPKIEIIDESQLVYAGDSETGEPGYFYLAIKEEIKEWMKILAPFISFGAAWLLAKRKK